MSRGKLAVWAGTLVAIVVAFFLAGRLGRPSEDWTRQHVNQSGRPGEFRNRFLGLTLRVPEDGDWQVVSDPERFRFQLPEFAPPPAGSLNKVLEIERMVGPREPAGQWARMDLFVEPVNGDVDPNQILRRLEFRDKRRGFTIVEEREVEMGGHRGTLRVGAWSVANQAYRVASYHVTHDDRLFALIGVSEAGAFERFRPAFDGIIASVRLR